MGPFNSKPYIDIKYYETKDKIISVLNFANYLKYYSEVDGVMVFPEKHRQKLEKVLCIHL